MHHQAGRSARAAAALRRPRVAGGVVLVVYALLSLANSTGGYLGTDTGAKVATLQHMVDGGTLSPDVGYWAEEWDPEGLYHPLLDTARNDEGEWVNVTTLPMLVVAWPLYALGGYRLALLVPMAGALLAAYACRDVARQLGDGRAGRIAFWSAALASPIAVYALDLWEHTLGAGLMVWAFALLLRVHRDVAPWWAPLVAGLALGASAAMRTETFVAAFVFVGTTCAVLAWRRQWGDAIRSGAVAVLGFGVTFGLNAALEAALGGNSRAERATGAATAGWWDELGTRFEEAALTWFGLPGAAYPVGALLGVVAIGSLVVAARLHDRGERPAAAIALAAAAASYAAGLSGGLAFVSGAFVAAPVAALVVLVKPWTGPRRFTGVVAVGTTVLIWMFQFTGGAGPQWGGRYILAPTLLFLALGAVAVRDADPIARASVVVAAVAVTVLGVVWLSYRSHEVDRLFDALARRPEDVIVSTNGFFVREAGPAYDDRRYLSLSWGTDVAGAVEVAEDAGADTVGVLTDSPAPPGGIAAGPVKTDEVEVFGVSLFLHSFRLDR